nr:LysM peptidoglycan-binding domain-containing protein [Gynuella sunshinyii]
MRKLWIAVIGLLFASAVFADVVKLRPDVPERYVVKKGDTLWGISNMFLEDPWLWPEIWYINPQIENPHLIYPGDEIGFITVGGERKLTIGRRGGAASSVVVESDNMQNGVVKLRPSVRVEPIESAIPAIPREFIDSFLSSNRIFDREELVAAPYILGGFEGRIVLGAGDIIYGRGDFGEVPAPSYQIYRPNPTPYVDPETSEILGYEGQSMGNATFERSNDNDISTLQIQRSNENVRIGDRLMVASNDLLESTFYPSAPKEYVSGSILAVLRGVRGIGQYDIVVLNLGDREGVKPGNILHVWHQGGVVKDPITNKPTKLPTENAGMLMIFRTFEKLSYGIILEATRPLSIGDETKTPGY